MSAYLCEPSDFAALARYAKRPSNFYGFTPYNLVTKERIGGNGRDMTVVDIALKLASANIVSVTTRYPNEPFGGFLDSDEDMIEFMGDVAREARVNTMPGSAAEMFRLVKTVEYQSCEVENWVETDAYWILDRIMDDCAMAMADNLLDKEEAA
jgi:hypothetical protein